MWFGLCCRHLQPQASMKGLQRVISQFIMTPVTSPGLMVNLPPIQITLTDIGVQQNNGQHTMEAHAVPDDRSMILQLVQHLKLTSTTELLPLQTIQQCHNKLKESSLSLRCSQSLSPISCLLYTPHSVPQVYVLWSTTTQWLLCRILIHTWKTCYCFL